MEVDLPDINLTSENPNKENENKNITSFLANTSRKITYKMIFCII